jgi:hypothetical protein
MLSPGSRSPGCGDDVARVFYDQTWFNSVRSRSWYEADYEQLVVSHSSDLFPEWIAASFKTNVVGDSGATKQPDLALIDPSYRRWWVVEVELAHHDLFTHVLPQVDAFRSGTYGEEHALYLHRKRPDLDLYKLKAMMSGEPPEVLVIVDRPDTNWKRSLKAIDVSLSIVEPFRGPNNQLLLRVNGDQPELPGNVLSRCSRGDARRLWRVHAPAALPAPTRSDEVFEIMYEDSMTQWKRLDLAGSVMLCVEQGGDVLSGLRAVDLVQHDDGSLSFQAVTRE